MERQETENKLSLPAQIIFKWQNMKRQILTGTLMNLESFIFQFPNIGWPPFCRVAESFEGPFCLSEGRDFFKEH